MDKKINGDKGISVLTVRLYPNISQYPPLSVNYCLIFHFLWQTLASAEGNILENKVLLESLNKTKASSMTIAESLQDAHRIQTTLDQVSRSLTFSKLIYLLQTLFQDHDTY